MPKTDIGPKIGIEGEAQFKKQIREINTEYKTLSTEVARVTSEFIGNEHSVEALTSVTNVLGAQEVELEKKQALLKEQLQKTAEAYGVADERTQKLTQEYNKNETQLNTLRAQIKSNEDEVKKLTEAEGENSESTEKSTGIMDQLGLSVESVGKKLGLSREQTNLLSEAFNGKGMSLAVAGAAAAAAVVLVGKAVKEAAEFMAGAVNDARAFADEINTLSHQTGFSTEFLQGLEYASERVDVSSESIVGSMKKLKKNLFSDSADVRAAFEQLNIIPEQLIQNETPIEDIFRLVIGGLQNVSNELERDNLAMTLFGKSADDLAGVIDDGGEKLYSLIDGYKDLGYVLSGDQLNALQEVDDAFVELDNELKAVKNQIAAEMAPALIELLTQLLAIAQSVDWKEFGTAAARVIEDVTPLIIDLADSVADLADSFANLINQVNEFKGTKAGGITGDVLKTIGTLASPYAMGAYAGDKTMGWIDAAKGLFGGSSSHQPINLSVNLDSQTIARATYDANRAENNRVGNHAIR